MSEDASSTGADVYDEDDDVGSENGSLPSVWLDAGPESYSLPTVECGPECPLRKPYIPIPDPPLPVAHASLPLT
jgi:hypothetical protein